MKRVILLAASVAAVLAATAAFRQAPRVVAFNKALAPGALLVIEARDFSALITDWNQSDRKKLWLQSDNYAVFSRSRVFQRLADLQGEYSAAAGFVPDFSLVQLCAGKESILALYAIPEAEFLYMTRTSAANVVQEVMAKSSAKYEPRESAGQPYFIRADKQSGRAAAFASFRDILLVATREDLIASALAALKGEARASVSDEPWYSTPVTAAGTPGELRLVMNLEALVKTPHFRSYWVQRNASEIRQYRSAISDLNRQPNQIDETRLFFRAQPAAVSPDSGSAGRMLALVPPTAGFYRAESTPSTEVVLERLTRKLLDPGPEPSGASREAPAAASPDSIAGTAADLETRIDEPPLKLNARADLKPVRDLLSQNRLLAELEIGSTALLPGGVLLEPRQAVALLAARPWNEAAVRAAFPSEVALRTRGPVLVAGRDPKQVQELVERTLSNRTNNVSYVAGFRYTQEFDRFVNLFRFLEFGGGNDSYQWQPGGNAAPYFFSGNLASLGRTLLKMESASITIREAGDRVEERVQYRLAP
ncbi:MAG: hypothetical protein IT160_05345 [Bryobacterales bacterium]|nr:hypothetical protein [Bryobacterales bacterium]